MKDFGEMKSMWEETGPICANGELMKGRENAGGG